MPAPRPPGALTTLSLAPQVVKAWHTRSTIDLSLATLIILLTGILLWFAHGVVREDFAIIAANGATAVLINLIPLVKAKHG